MASFLRTIEDHLNRFVFFPQPGSSLALALWVAHTHTFHPEFPFNPWVTGYIYVNGPSGSGKTQILDLCEPLAYNVERAVDMSASTLFRLIDSQHPTLLIDEVDAWVKDETRRGAINGGYKHGGYVWRTAPGPEGPEPRKFFTYGPKMFAGIDNGKLPETILNRTLPITLRKIDKEAPEEQRDRFYPFKVGPKAEKLGREINEWVLGKGLEIADYEPSEEGFANRDFEVAYSLLQVAHADGREAEARRVLGQLCKARGFREDPGVSALRKIKALFDDREASLIPASEILAGLGIDNGKTLGGLLRPYQIGSSTAAKLDGRYVKCFKRSQFEDAWRHWL